MNRKTKVVILAGFLYFLIAIIVACATQQVAPQKAQPEPQVAQAQLPAESPPAPPPPEEVKPVSLYEAEVKPLSPVECGRCHFSVYSQIKNEGGKHQLDCTQCHTEYHVYNPVKQNWKDIMPKCETCHGLIHGQKFAACSQCHGKPHAPKTQIAGAELAKACADCHAKVPQEIQTSPSKHAKVACNTCHHQKHGYIPSCMECHKPHTENQTVKDCLTCHPAHVPLVIAYPQTTPNSLCGACHAPVYQKLEASTGKHRLVACAQCHTKHKYIPKCEECHGKPHGEGLLKKFPQCTQCHMDVHDLPGIGAR
ncbi:MAG: cytochrome C [Nitrospirota bacterium]